MKSSIKEKKKKRKLKEKEKERKEEKRIIVNSLFPIYIYIVPIITQTTKYSNNEEKETNV